MNDTAASPPDGRLERLCRDIQQLLPSSGRWVCADEVVLRSAAAGEQVVRGSRGRRLHGILQVAGNAGLAWAAVWLLGLLTLAALLARQCLLPLPRHPAPTTALRLFVGFGAGAEAQIFDRYRANFTTDPVRLDETDLLSFARHQRLRLAACVRSFAAAIRTMRSTLAHLPAPLSAYRKDLFTSCAMRMPRYAFQRAWFEHCAARSGATPVEVAVLTTSVTAHAAVDAGLHTVFLQHGLVYHAPLPGFSGIEALTADEARHFRSLLPAASIRLVPALPAPGFPGNSRDILIASVYGNAAFKSLMDAFLDWARAHELRLLVRLHPREQDDYWDTKALHGFAFQPMPAAETLYSLMQRVRPRLLVSWYSTALAESLDWGVIPVSICPPDDRNVADMVYPLFLRCLQWPRDEHLVRHLLTDDALYLQTLARLRQALSGAPS